MSIRPDAKQWLLQHDIVLTEPLYTSKLYSPSTSWTGAEAWWIQVPLHHIEDDVTVHIVCESETPAIPFRYLAVPARFFREKLPQLGMIGDHSINLFLSAEPHQLLTDLRGPGKIDFSSYVVEVTQ